MRRTNWKTYWVFFKDKKYGWRVDTTTAIEAKRRYLDVFHWVDAKMSDLKVIKGD